MRRYGVQNPRKQKETCRHIKLTRESDTERKDK
jgi:hypothetical protein